MSKKKKSALSTKQGVSQNEMANSSSISKIRQKRKVNLNADSIVARILDRDITALSRAITLIESKNTKHTELAKNIIQTCLPHANKSIRIGITGVPGVGKSTFIEALGKHLTHTGKRVAVLAIDPSSSITKGSILGDKTRMEDLVRDDKAYIRPSASGETLGGVARKTRESIILCEAAGFDVVIIETVGVGQSETVVHSMVDFFLLLKLAGAGDELQGIKRGIIEMADAIVINKADGDNLKKAKLAQVEFKRALHLYPKKESNWQPQVSLCSALNNEGVSDIWNLILNFIEITSHNGYFERKRKQQSKHWLLQTIENQLKSDFFKSPKIQDELNRQLVLIENNKTTPFVAADCLLKLIK
ncbi:methylmalonyl Co-A mutase-associated GTPase MeaB [Cognatitamlana onchidii]|uniref:methylmalonyl Co-A mutase-associated GTPase MeaB n=1 Tax=Cognatitamlana onchidii TaxID=2562860 RepID=UPI001F2EE887|nr:methylmalonyl Co-A mutase-associated GTPase MeaB [Algibacter onchidii]